MNHVTIHIKNLCKTFKQPKHTITVLDHLDFQGFDSESAAIIGQSGSGKSTFLSLIAGLDDADSGEIILLDQSLQSMDTTQRALFRRDHIGMIFQEFHLMDHLSAQENVALALEIAQTRTQPQKMSKASIASLSLQALADVGLADRCHHLPSELSGGEKQRVAIARAFVTQPKILIADEPSGNLDPDTGEGVMEILWKLVKKRHMTLILVTHNPLLAKKCHKIYTLKKGKLVSSSDV
ncbi:MAG: ABC transporter ATP-binding protein [Proteobacteria bacterium]|nr:ABC transporter ATP-binding protein [Pseudomonadota bacterium]